MSSIAEIKQLAKKIQKEVDANGWSITAHTMILALLHMLTKAKVCSLS
jgi:hypothetical protein